MFFKSNQKSSVCAPKNPLVLTLPDTLFQLPPKEPLFQTSWPEIQSFLQSLLSTFPTTLQYQTLFERIEYLCRNRLEKPLYSSLLSFFEDFFKSEIESLSQQAENPNLLSQTALFWTKLSQSFPIISGVFRYFESSYLRSVLRYKSLEVWILTRLAICLKKYDILKSNIIQKTLVLILLERDNKLAEPEVLYSLMKLIEAIPEYYRQSFEPEFLKLSEGYYKVESEKLVKSIDFDLRNYLKYVERRFIEENNRVRALLEIGTNTDLIKILENELIINHLQKILETCSDLILSKDLEGLKRLYYLLGRVNKLEYLKKTWGSIIKERGKTLVLAGKDGLLDGVLVFRRDLMEIVKSSFDGNKALKGAIDGSFENFLNLSPNNTAEMASKQFDMRLRKRGKIGAFDEEEVKQDLDELFELFRYLSAKDIFEEFYTRRLAKRLFFGGISSHELERHVLEKLKNECGSSYTKKAEEIFKDVEISKQINLEFENFRKNSGLNVFPNMEFYVTVLHSNSWPLLNNNFQTLLEPFDTLKNCFMEFYNKKQLGVLLSWQYEGSFCELYGFFKGEKYLLNVSILQAMLLIMFNTKKVLTFKEICELLNFDEEEIRKSLYSLYFMKEKLMLKSGEGKTILNEDEFCVNENYQSKLKMIKVNSVQKKETAEEIQETQDKVLQERQYLVDACIVRIIKSKKSIGHNELVNEVFNDLKLPLLVSDTKKRIESLIGRDYLMRDKNNSQIYHYVA